MRMNVTNTRDNKQNNKMLAQKGLLINNLLEIYFSQSSLPHNYTI